MVEEIHHTSGSLYSTDVAQAAKCHGREGNFFGQKIAILYFQFMAGEVDSYTAGTFQTHI